MRNRATDKKSLELRRKHTRGTINVIVKKAFHKCMHAQSSYTEEKIINPSIQISQRRLLPITIFLLNFELQRD
jgi:hypothetical protein